MVTVLVPALMTFEAPSVSVSDVIDMGALLLLTLPLAVNVLPAASVIVTPLAPETFPPRVTLPELVNINVVAAEPVKLVNAPVLAISTLPLLLTTLRVPATAVSTAAPTLPILPFAELIVKLCAVMTLEPVTILPLVAAIEVVSVADPTAPLMVTEVPVTFMVEPAVLTAPSATAPPTFMVSALLPIVMVLPPALKPPLPP